MDKKNIFGPVLVKYRKKNNLSQEKLADICGLDRSFISQLERGLNQPTLTTLLLLSKALKTTASILVNEVEENLK